MNANELVAIAFAALLIVPGGAVAAPGQAPDHAGADATDAHQPDNPGAEATGNATDNGTDADGQRDQPASDGPPTRLPAHVPDHVSQIHELIRAKLSGELGNVSLGEAISGVGGTDDSAQANGQADRTGRQSEDANETSQSGRSNPAHVGPSGGLPAQAADHASQIHETIGSYLDGSIERLGDALHTVLGGEAGPSGSTVGPNVDTGEA